MEYPEINRLLIGSFDHFGTPMEMQIAYFDYKDLLKCIDEGAKHLGLDRKVYLIANLPPEETKFDIENGVNERENLHH